MLYWAEGAKARNQINFVNSDENMMIFFMRFLREELGVQDDEMKLSIHCHTADEDEKQRIGQYWCDLLDLPASVLEKIKTKKGSNTRKTRLKNGICAIRIYRVKVVQHIYGAIQEYAGFDNPDWLF